MPSSKSTDPIESLRPTSRKVLEQAPEDGRYLVPYTVGRAFAQRGWGTHLGRGNSRTGGTMPTSLFQLSPNGLAAAEEARRRSRASVEQVKYQAVREATLTEMSALLEDFSLDELIRSATGLVQRVEQAGESSASARGYLDALVEYRDEQARVTA